MIPVIMGNHKIIDGWEIFDNVNVRSFETGRREMNRGGASAENRVDEEGFAVDLHEIRRMSKPDQDVFRGI